MMHALGGYKSWMADGIVRDLSPEIDFGHFSGVIGVESNVIECGIHD